MVILVKMKIYLWNLLLGFTNRRVNSYKIIYWKIIIISLKLLIRKRKERQTELADFLKSMSVTNAHTSAQEIITETCESIYTTVILEAPTKRVTLFIKILNRFLRKRSRALFYCVRTTASVTSVINNRSAHYHVFSAVASTTMNFPTLVILLYSLGCLCNGNGNNVPVYVGKSLCCKFNILLVCNIS